MIMSVILIIIQFSSLFIYVLFNSPNADYKLSTSKETKNAYTQTKVEQDKLYYLENK
jgi:hypothetical protein